MTNYRSIIDVVEKKDYEAAREIGEWSGEKERGGGGQVVLVNS